MSIKDLITHRFSFVDVLSAYQMLLKGKSSQIGVVLDYSKEGSPRTNEQEDVIIRKQGVNLEADKGGRRNIGLIGGGAFTKNILLPVLTKIRNIELVGVATTRGMTSEHIASKFDFKYFTTDYKEILEDKNIRSVFITTRHGSHSKFVVEALQHNKDVFVEKPLCLNKGELSEIKGAFQKTNNDLMVGFNRRYSSLVKDIKEFFDKDEPFVINCRINAGFIDSSHWTQGFAEGGGRIIGEVCHFVDLLQFITSSYPIKVYTEGISNSNNYSPNDNIISVIKFQDGSVANITYTSKGSKSYSREILEIYQRNSVYYLEDFKKAIKIKAGTKKKKKLFSQDMGYLDELKCFFSDNVKKINFNDYLINSLTVFAIQESLREGRLVTISNTI